MADTNLFNGGQPDPNAGASGSWQDPSQMSPQAMAALQQLVQTSQQQQNTPAMSMVGANGQPAVGNVQGQQIDPQMQKSATKALQQYYDAHAQQALMHPDGIKALSAIANSPQGGQSQPAQGQQQAQYPQVPQANPQGGQQQQMQMPTGGILSKLLGVDLNPIGTGQRLQNAGKLQEINAGQPSTIQLPSSQAAAVRSQTEMQNLQNSGNEPIQPKEYMSAYAGMYQKALDSYGKVSDNISDIAKTSQDLFTKTADTTRNAFQKAIGSQSSQSMATFQSAVAAQKAALDASMDFHSFLFKNNPGQIMNQIANKVSNSGSGGIKVGDKFNGETVVNVKRIK